MKKITIKVIIAVCLLTTLYSCTSGGSGGGSTSVTPDSTFNGSYLQISYNGNNYNSKSVAVGSMQYNVLISIATTYDSTHNEIAIAQTLGISGINIFQFYLLGTGNTTGTFTFSSPISWLEVTSSLEQSNPSNVFADTSGTANITHNGSDYLQGTFTTTLYASGFSYPATGSFKIYH